MFKKIKREYFQTSYQIAGWIILASSFVMLFVMAHHPTISSGNDQDQLREIIRESALNSMVHGIMIFLVGFLWVGLLMYSQKRGFDKISIIIATVSFSVGSIAFIGAAIINGFAVAGVAEHFLSASEEELSKLKAIRLFSWEINQALANLGVAASGFAIFFWSLNLLKHELWGLFIGLTGMIIGLGMTLAIFTGWLDLHLTGMTIALAAESIWLVLVSVQLIRKRL